VADGLGHGPDAAEAAAVALEAFAEDPFAAPRDQLQRAHQALRRTRGAAIMLLQADAGQGAVRSSGAGNVVGRLVSGVSDRTVLTQHGTAGVTIRTPDETVTPWPEHALLVVCTDGIETRWKAEALMPLLGRDPTLAAALLVRDHCRGRDDATVAVLRRKD
jgi:serine/threonine protein phosphatase PrpC